MIDKISRFDNNVYEMIYNMKSKTIITFMKIITQLGSVVGVTVVTLLILLCVLLNIKKDYKEMSHIVKVEAMIYNIIYIAISILFPLVFGHIMKAIISRDRPIDNVYGKVVSGYSFPSMHTMMVSSYCSVIASYIVLSGLDTWIKSTIIILLLMLSILVGASRVFLSVHYVSDVVCGLVIGWLIPIIVMLLFLGILRKKNKYNYMKL